MLPEIKSSSEVYGTVEASSLLREVPIAGILGDQQAATFGQAAFDQGESKNTYGTGNFLIFNTGEEIVHSKNGLLTTLGYKLGDAAPHYALEGSIAVTGSLIQWLRDNLGIIGSAPEVEELAKSVEDNGGVYFVPAFSGLFAPYWRSDARGALVGLTRYVNKGHIARAALEATAFQTREVLDAVNADSGVDLTELKVDGGMTANDALMQFQADILDVPVVRPVVAETTALGAAYAAGLAVGFWETLDDLRAELAGGQALDAEHRGRRARPHPPPLEEGRHEDLRLGRRGRQLTPGDTREGPFLGTGPSVVPGLPAGRAAPWRRGAPPAVRPGPQAVALDRVAATHVVELARSRPPSRSPRRRREQLLAEPRHDRPIALGLGPGRQPVRDEAGRGVEQDDVADGAGLAGEDPARHRGVVLGVAADEVVDARRAGCPGRGGRGRAP